MEQEVGASALCIGSVDASRTARAVRMCLTSMRPHSHYLGGAYHSDAGVAIPALDTP